MISIEERRRRDAERSRRWRRANPERHREQRQRQFWRDPEKARARARLKSQKFRQANPEKAREAYRKYHAANPAAATERKRRWREANPDKEREAAKRHYWANPEKAREKQRAATKRYRETKVIPLAVKIVQMFELLSEEARFDFARELITEIANSRLTRLAVRTWKVRPWVQWYGARPGEGEALD
ncbi:hypothetical protein [Mesorhizobium sp. B2-6-2]|uniref:hypothetical protein n=1 Tax=Mesorhizobium sp. B2-6-2 TaxID=2589915 RepID=UPI00112D45F7|nr:hypothetical protein [Mesorhizobium sp. B2-6-2]TPJ72450.1 hypothetical protein FJ419_28035 [Mesorhizobium sp. B2-6-2]